jgi:hypothetical protein
MVVPGGVRDAEVSVRRHFSERTFQENAAILHAQAHLRMGKPTPARDSRQDSDLAPMADRESGRKAPQHDALGARLGIHTLTPTKPRLKSLLPAGLYWAVSAP